MKVPATEQEAWQVVTTQPARQRYEHLATYCNQVFYRQKFISKIQREPGGCWVWIGKSSVNTPSGNRTPRFGHRVMQERNGRSAYYKTDTAFTWMMSQWFSEDVVRRAPTKVSCGNYLCVSPIHRKVTKEYGGNRKLDPVKVLDIYSSKGDHVGEVAARYNISRGTVYDIWRDRAWTEVTSVYKQGLRVGQGQEPHPQHDSSDRRDADGHRPQS